MNNTSLLIDAEVTLTKEEFFLFNELTSKLEMDIGRVIIHLATLKAKELEEQFVLDKQLPNQTDTGA